MDTVPGSWPTLSEQREALSAMRAVWLMPYRPMRTHVVAQWSERMDTLFRDYQRRVKQHHPDYGKRSKLPRSKRAC